MIIKDNIDKFANNIKHAYHKYSWAKKLCVIKPFSQDNQNSNFVQIPIRIKMNNSDFSGEVDNEFLGEQLGEQIASGEFNYIISRFNEEDKLKPIDTPIPTSKQIISMIREFEKEEVNIKFILIPTNSELYGQVYELVDQGMATYEEHRLFITINYSKIEVIKSNRQRPFDDIYIIGEQAIKWISKKKEEMAEIKNINESEYDSWKNSSVNMSIIYKKYQTGKIDFIARVVGYADVDFTKVRRHKLKYQNKPKRNM